MMLALFAVGVGVGSIVAERLLHGEVSARFVPIAAAAMAFFAWDLHAASAGRPSVPELATVSAFLSAPGSWRILVDLVGVAMAGGLYTVPLYAILQHESEPAHRARVIAANNIINALAMAIAAIGAAALLARGLTMGELFALCGLLTIPVALVAAWILRRTMAKMLPAIDSQNPLPRESRGTRARACGAPESGDRRQSRVVSRWTCCWAHSCLAIRSSPSTL